MADLTARELSPHERATWDALVTEHRCGHLLQTSTWADFKARFGWRAAQVALLEGERLAGGAQVLFRTVRGQTMAYVPKGPVIDWDDPMAFWTLLPALHQVCRRAGAFFLRIEPELEETIPRHGLLQARGFVPARESVQPRSTVHVDLRPELSAIAARLKSKWRYNIGLAERKGVQVRRALGDAEIGQFYRLLTETAARDSFGIHSEEYYRQVWHFLHPAGLAALFVASYQGVDIAAILVFAAGGRAIYMYGASASNHRSLMPNHLLQWEAMKWARLKGCQTYDLWGIPPEIRSGPDGEPVLLDGSSVDAAHREGGLWGVYRFKQGFGGRVVRYVGAYDFPYGRLRYWMWNRLLPLLQRNVSFGPA